MKDFISLKISQFLFLDLNLNLPAKKILLFSNYPIIFLESEKNFTLARIYFIEGRLYEALDKINQSIDVKPEIAEYYYLRGLIKGFLGGVQIYTATDDFQKYIDLSLKQLEKPGLWAGYNDLAWVYFLLGNFKKSEEISKEALNFSPNNPWLLNMLGSSLIEQNKCEEAKKYLSIAEYYAKNITVDEFGQAYSGDSKKWWPKGLDAMKKTISENLKICENLSTPK